MLAKPPSILSFLAKTGLLIAVILTVVGLWLEINRVRTLHDIQGMEFEVREIRIKKAAYEKNPDKYADRMEALNRDIDAYQAKSKRVDTDEEAYEEDAGLLAMIFLGFSVLLALVIAFWIERAHRFSRNAGANTHTISPVMAVAWFLVPIWNLWKPHEAMRELWDGARQLSPNRINEGKLVLGGWWALWLINLFVGRLTMRLMRKVDPNSLESIIGMTYLSIAGYLLYLVLCFFAYSLIASVSRAHKEAAGNAESEHEDPVQAS